MLGPAAAYARGDRIADASEDHGLVSDLVAGAGEAGRGDCQDEVNIGVVVVLEDGRMLMSSPCASARTTFRFLPTEMPLCCSPSSMPSTQRSVLMPGAIETIAALNVRLAAGDEPGICGRSQRGVAMSEV